MTERSAKEVVGEMFRRQQAGDDTALDDLVAADMVNHAAGPQGREGLKGILRTIDNDLGPVTVEQHHLIGEGDLVAQHLTLHGTHRGSTMPLLASTAVSGRCAFSGWRGLPVVWSRTMVMTSLTYEDGCPPATGPLSGGNPRIFHVTLAQVGPPQRHVRWISARLPA